MRGYLSSFVSENPSFCRRGFRAARDDGNLKPPAPRENVELKELAGDGLRNAARAGRDVRSHRRR
jgi:hypothetical protein